jgi:hypothetical protein
MSLLQGNLYFFIYIFKSGRSAWEACCCCWNLVTNCFQTDGEQECLCRDGLRDAKWLVNSRAQKRMQRSVALFFHRPSPDILVLWFHVCPNMMKCTFLMLCTVLHYLHILPQAYFTCKWQVSECALFQVSFKYNWFPNFKFITHTSTQLTKHTPLLCCYQKHNTSLIGVR